MGQVEPTTGRYRSLRHSAIASDLSELLAQAKAKAKAKANVVS